MEPEEMSLPTCYRSVVEATQRMKVVSQISRYVPRKKCSERGCQDRLDDAADECMNAIDHEFLSLWTDKPTFICMPEPEEKAAIVHRAPSYMREVKLE